MHDVWLFVSKNNNSKGVGFVHLSIEDATIQLPFRMYAFNWPFLFTTIILTLPKTYNISLCTRFIQHVSKINRNCAVNKSKLRPPHSLFSVFFFAHSFARMFLFLRWQMQFVRWISVFLLLRQMKKNGQIIDYSRYWRIEKPRTKNSSSYQMFKRVICWLGNLKSIQRL